MKNSRLVVVAFMFLFLARCVCAGDAPLLNAESRKLIGSASARGNVMGYSVSIHGDVAAVGAPGAFNGHGAVLIFQRDAGTSNRWGLVKKMEVNGLVFAGTPRGFGYSVSVWSNRLAVGTPDIDVRLGSSSAPAADGGVVAIYQRDTGGTNNWGLSVAFLSPTYYTGDGFGTAVSLQSNRLAVSEISARNDVLIESVTGHVHIIEYTGVVWTNRRQITSGDATFGKSVSLSGDRVAVGVPGKADFGFRTGAAYVFDRSLGGADNWGQERKILATDAQSNALFGVSISLEGTNVLVGASYLATGQLLSGAAYLFNRGTGGTTNWGQVKKFTPLAPEPYGQFGDSVALQGTNCAIGMPGLGYLAEVFYTNPAPGVADGSVFMYQRDAGGAGTWGQVRAIKRIDDGGGNGFGIVSLDRDDLLVGATDDEESGLQTGRAFVFNRGLGGIENWGLRRILDYEDRNVDDRFGTAVAIDGNTAVVTAPLHERPGYSFGAGFTNVGMVYSFLRQLGGTNNWGFAQAIEAPSSIRNDDEWGTSVAIYSNILVVGCPKFDGTNLSPNIKYNVGTVAVYERTAADQLWTFKTFLHPDDGNTNDNFGTSVAIVSNLIFVGIPGYDGGAQDGGAVYIYKRDPTNWTLNAPIIAYDPNPGARFGSSIAVTKNTGFIGAPGDNQNGTNSGAVYAFALTGGGVRKIFPADPAINSQFGSAVSAASDLVLVGAWQASVPALFSGAAYLFQQNYGGPTNWGQIKKFTPPATNAGLSFGYSVALDKVSAVVGAIGDTNGSPNAGALYVYFRNEGGTTNWGLLERLTASDATNNALLGYSTALYDTTIIGGAPVEGTLYGLTNAGAAYVFDTVRNEIRGSRRNGNNLDLDLTVSPGRVYRIQHSTNMVDWLPTLATTYTAGDTYTSTTITNGFPSTNRAFRLRYVAPPAVP